MPLSRKSLISIGSGALTVLPVLAWAGNEVWSALKAAERIPIIEYRLERSERETREVREILLEMLALHTREAGRTRRAQELETELKQLRGEEAK